jgi:hypothetical protein
MWLCWFSIFTHISSVYFCYKLGNYNDLLFESNAGSLIGNSAVEVIIGNKGNISTLWYAIGHV